MDTKEIDTGMKYEWIEGIRYECSKNMNIGTLVYILLCDLIFQVISQVFMSMNIFFSITPNSVDISHVRHVASGADISSVTSSRGMRPCDTRPALTYWSLRISRNIQFRRDMETRPTLMALSEGNPLVADGFPSQRTSHRALVFSVLETWTLTQQWSCRRFATS